MSWGGAYTKSQVEAYHKPFTAETGINVVSVDADNPGDPDQGAGRGRQRHRRTSSTSSTPTRCGCATRACSSRSTTRSCRRRPTAPPPRRTSSRTRSPTAVVPTIVYSTVFAYDDDQVPEKPTTIADFFDLEKFPGKRAMRAQGRQGRTSRWR